MRATIHLQAIILTTARVVVSIVRGVLWPEYCLCGVSYFLLPLPNHTNILACFY